MITSCNIDFSFGEQELEVMATVKVYAKTGVEMEALTAVSIACLCVYDMCKGIDKDMVISDIMLISKSGGQSGIWTRG
jgi:cyclic pyranopterin phosphate synthase